MCVRWGESYKGTFRYPPRLSREPQGEAQSLPDLSHSVWGQGRDHGPDPSPGYGLNVIQVDGTGSRHAVFLGQWDLRRDISDRGGDRSHGDFSEKLERGIPR